MNSEASKSLTVDTVCNISEPQEVELELAFKAAEVVAPVDNTSLDRGCRDIIPLAEPVLSAAQTARSLGEKTEIIKKVSETNNSELSAAVTEVSSFYDISYCSKV